jgi:sialate O-acetylesterase
MGIKMKINKKILVVFSAIFFFQSMCYAKITLPKVFKDSMVLQRGITIPVWGQATPGSVVIANLGTVRVSTKADKQGNWMLYFPKRREGGPYDLEVFESGKPDTGIKLKGILIGDVWQASGQSSMEWQVQQVQANRDLTNLIHSVKSFQEYLI